jgi:leader peptidase (prepilin peptidase)/N-methyltransferase
MPKMMEREWHANCLDLQGQPVQDQPKYNLVVPRSTCPNCGHMISALENIPVISYLFLRGRCQACKTSISMRYPLVEALTGCTVAGSRCAIWLQPPDTICLDIRVCISRINFH